MEYEKVKRSDSGGLSGSRSRAIRAIDRGAQPQPSSMRGLRLPARLAALFAVIVAVALSLIAFAAPTYAYAQEAATAGDAQQQPAQQQLVTAYFFNIGQGDSEFVTFPDGQNLLIDAGPAEAGSAIVNWLNANGVTKIDHVVATHPHEDHIGGMAQVISSFDIGDVWMPEGADADTQTYLNLLQTLSDKGATVYDAYAGETVVKGDNYSVDIVSPQQGETFSDLNDYSAELLLTYGTTKFLFTGDASTEVTQAAVTEHVDVLKVAHHGSDTGTTAALMQQLTPKIAVIECSADNSYGHPTQQTLDALASVGAQVYATFANGIVTVTSDGTNVAAQCEVQAQVTTQEARAAAAQQEAQAAAAAQAAQEQAAQEQAAQEAAAAAAAQEQAAAQAAQAQATAAPAADEGSETVYITKTGEKYHRAGCQYLKKSSIPISKSDAIAQGYTPCSRCNP